jgi:sugar lactone lactonase YvrE
MQLSTPTLLLDAKAALSEGPSWDAARQLLYWIDIYAGHLHVYNPVSGEDRIHALGQSIGCVAPARSGRLVLAVRDGLATLDLFTDKTSDAFLEAPTLKFLAQPELHLPGNRYNDGKCGPDGRFLAGSMEQAEEHNTGSFYSLSPDGTLKTLLTGLGISNGLAWSPDHKTLYHIDTPTHNVMAYDYDLTSGEIANGRLAVRVPDEFGWPDGMTSDTQGRLWVALWGGAGLTVWEPGTGQLLERIPIPAKNVSACVFGGPERNQLYVTSARKGLDEATLAEYPLTGGLFRIETDVEGMSTFQFGD